MAKPEEKLDQNPATPTNVDESPDVPQEEIDDLLAWEEDGGTTTEPEVKEPEQEEANAEPESDDSGEEEEEAPPEGEAEPEPEEEETPPDGDGLSEADLLRQQLNNLAGILQSHGINPSEVLGQAEADSSSPEQPPAAPPVTPQAPVQPQAQSPIPFEIAEDEFENMLEDRNLFNQVFQRAIQASSQNSNQSLMPAIAQQVQTQVALQGAVQEFYGAHKDLAPHRQFVSLVTQELIAKNPEWTLDKVFTETATETRKRLGIKAEQQPRQTTRRPGLARSTTRPAPQAEPQLQGVEAELADLLPED